MLSSQWTAGAEFQLSLGSDGAEGRAGSCQTSREEAQDHSWEELEPACAAFPAPVPSLCVLLLPPVLDSAQFCWELPANPPEPPPAPHPSVCRPHSASIPFPCDSRLNWQGKILYCPSSHSVVNSFNGSMTLPSISIQLAPYEPKNWSCF